jgi:uncharacterized protein (DUF2267 family)
MAENVQPGEGTTQPFRKEAFYAELAHELPDKPPREAAEAVLCTLTHKLPGGVMVRLERELPSDLVVMMLHACPFSKEKQAEHMGTDHFFRRVGAHLDVDVLEGPRVTRAVFRVLHRHLSTKDEKAILSELPRGLQDIWLDEARRDRGAAEEQPAP